MSAILVGIVLAIFEQSDMKLCQTIEGTRSHHVYLPGANTGTLRLYRVSSDISSEMYTNVHLKESKTESNANFTEISIYKTLFLTCSS